MVGECEMARHGVNEFVKTSSSVLFGIISCARYAYVCEGYSDANCLSESKIFDTLYPAFSRRC